MQGTIEGPQGTPYADGFFFLEIVMPQDYPHHPPKVKFTTKIYHMNVTDKGEICMAKLKDDWKPVFEIKDILTDIRALMITPDVHNALNQEVAQKYLEDRNAHDAAAKQYCENFAQ